MTSETTAKKDIQKLQRAIVDGLEDVKGQDIVVFNTESMSPLFERVIIASGTSNRQTKALAASVRDAVREAGFDKPRIEGEDNGEWIIVDCGAAVAHVMQPVIRQYYRLEEIWGAKPVRLKHGDEKVVEIKPVTKKAAAKTTKKGVVKEVKPVDAKSVARKAAKAISAAAAPAKTAAKPGTKTGVKAVAKSAAKTSAKTAAPIATRKPAAKAAPTKAPLKTVVVKPKSATRPAAKSAAKPAAKRAAPATKVAAKSAPKKRT
ncbi:ribosome silencing factor [Hydrogenophaga sp. A37]|uniref:ribosome silencing factor n=1 Tax=Hydrogenophaga sp. A37 TaxID=1945864 RepID=UPI0009852802|nr:ribosome silencing factor [Hydrogenophaga sp. A37]OOG81347.1 ribosome silencing factor [Hydrogenophaga sp. A37]